MTGMMSFFAPRRKLKAAITLIAAFIMLVIFQFMSLNDISCHFDPDLHSPTPSSQIGPPSPLLPICGCRRNVSSGLDSSCSDEYSQDSSCQKVISYSYFDRGSNALGLEKHDIAENYSPSIYRIGILKNLKAMRQLYPDFVMRLYTDVPLEGGFCRLLCENPHLHWCDIRKTPSHGDLSSMPPMTWRFLVLGDPTVDIFLTRDLDSMLTERDQAAVADWLKATDKAIHIMRDNQYHRTEMLGGLWGASNSRLVKSVGSTSVAERRADIIETSSSNHFSGNDQNILTNRLYNYYKNESVAHDSYSCKEWGDDLIRPFPIKRKNANKDFVGCPNLGVVNYKLPKCPEECRPWYGKKWMHC